jgi:hypothetical protein
VYIDYMIVNNIAKGFFIICDLNVHTLNINGICEINKLNKYNVQLIIVTPFLVTYDIKLQ